MKGFDPRSAPKLLTVLCSCLALAAAARADTDAAGTTAAIDAMTNAVAAAASATAAATADPGPFSGDQGWMQGNSRWNTNPFDSKYFSPQFICDVHYNDNLAHPVDHVQVGSTAAFTTDEFEIQQLGVGGDVHIPVGDDGGVVRGRFMTEFGTDSELVPRDDGSEALGTDDLYGAYGYLSEAYGGYHWDALHGVNLDVGLFPSYVGLYSYYNTENWTYQASYVSSNTPWFFTGARLQIFETDRLKTEFWLINGWQTYGMYNDRLCEGFQFKYTPTDDWDFVSNGYVGTDQIDSPNLIRLHSDNSIQYRDYNNPNGTFISRNASSLTFDIGGQAGPMYTGLSSSGTPEYVNTTMGPGPNEEAFFGAMFYNRTQFYKNLFAFTWGGGFVNNPGRYLVLLPNINLNGSATGTLSETNIGSTGVTGDAPYFTEGPGQSFIGEDFELAFDYMPNDYLTWRVEYDHAETNVPYYSGPGGITSSDGTIPAAGTGAAQTDGTLTSGFQPDLVKFDNRIELVMLIEI